MLKLKQFGTLHRGTAVGGETHHKYFRLLAQLCRKTAMLVIAACILMSKFTDGSPEADNNLFQRTSEQLAATDTFYVSNAPFSGGWSSIASDSTGRFLAATKGNYIYTTSDYGSIWLRSSAPSTVSWIKIASDSSGQYLAATASNGIYVSSDYGLSWVKSSAPSVVSWWGIASDSTGRYLAACTFQSGIFTSANYGTDWIGTNSSSFNVLFWFGIASDSTGQFLVAVGSTGATNGGVIYTSSNSGLTWIQRTAPAKNCRTIASDSTGQYLAAGIYCGSMYTSSDYGLSWIQQPAAPTNKCWTGIASDSTGQYLVACEAFNSGGTILISTNYGVSWTVANAPTKGWAGVTSDSTGQYLAAATTGIYTTVQPDSSQPTSQPSRAPSGQPFSHPSAQPTLQPQALPTAQPTSQPSMMPSLQPQAWPSSQPSSQPSMRPTLQPQAWPSSQPSSQPSMAPSLQPQAWPSSLPSPQPSSHPTMQPTLQPSSQPSLQPSFQKTAYPSAQPSNMPSRQPSAQPSFQPSIQPTNQPTSRPSALPSGLPTRLPTTQPTAQPSRRPTNQPFASPSAQPTGFPSSLPGSFKSTVSVTAKTPTFNTTIANLGHYSVTYVTVQLLLSYLSVASGGFVTITAGSGNAAVVVGAACAPVTACNMQPTYCSVNVDVSGAMTNGKGGSVELHAAVNTQHLSGSTPVLCNYGGKFGIYYQLNYTVSAFLQPTHQPTRVPTIEPTKSGGTVVINTGSHLVTSGGAPFYVIGFIAAAFTVLGVILVRIHDENQKITPLKLLTTCFTFALLGNTVLSELFYVIVLIQAGDGVLQACAIALIVLRLVNATVALFVLYRLFAPVSHLYALLDNNQLLKQARIYSMLQIIMLFDVSIVRYLPWLVSEMTMQAMGVPEFGTFRLCLSTKILLSGASLVIQAVVLVKLNESSIDNSYTLGLVVLNMVVTVLVFISGAITAMLQMRAIKRDTSIASQRDRGSTFSANNPMTQGVVVEMTQMQHLESGEGGLQSALGTIEALNHQAALIEELTGKLAMQEHELRALRAFVEERLGNMVAPEASSSIL